MRTCTTCGGNIEGERRYCGDCGALAPSLGMAPTSPIMAAPVDPMIGMVLGGNYQVVEAIGAGGMGKVYLGNHTTLSKPVAIKVLHSSLGQDPTITQRFEQEAQAASRLNHPNSISVLDFGQGPGGMLFLVMEYVRGTSLGDILQTHGPLPYVRTVGIVGQMLGALAQAHALGIIHRDLKPDNIMIQPLLAQGDLVKVLDFGIAKVRGTPATNDRFVAAVPPGPSAVSKLNLGPARSGPVTAYGLICGTPEYMAPEQVRGDEEVDGRADLYAVGAILYQMVTGSPPFMANKAMDVLMMQLSNSPDPPRVRAPEREIPASLEAIIIRALAKRAEDRFQSATEFKHVLEAWNDAQLRAAGVADHARVACPSCGAPVTAEARFCPSCGAQMRAAVGPLAPARQQPKTMAPFAGGLLESLSSSQNVRLVRATADMPRLDSAPSTLEAAGERSPESVPLVGRALELGRLDLFLGEIGRGVGVRLSGEVGSGRSRLLRELCERALRSNVRLVELSTPPDALAPLGMARRVLSALLGLTSRPDAGALSAALDRYQLSRWTTALAPIFALARPRSVIGAEAERRELMIGVEQVARAVAAERTTLVVIDDADRADGPSRGIFERLLTLRAPGLGVAVSESPRHPLNVPTPVCKLEPLDDAEAAQHLRTLAGGIEPGSDLAGEISAVVGAARGNPQFLEELFRFAVFDRPGAPLPTSLAEVLEARISGLPVGARELLQAAAVLGDEAPFDSVTAVAQSDEPEMNLIILGQRALLGLISGPKDSGSMEPGSVEGRSQGGPEGRWVRFYHPFLREVVSAGTPAEVRRTLHRRALKLRGRQGADVFELCFHAHEGGGKSEAVQLGLRASAAAERLGDPQSVVTFSGWAVAAARADLLASGGDPTCERAFFDSAVRLADGLFSQGDQAAAEGIVREALAAVDMDRLRLAEGRRRLARILDARGFSERALAELSEGAARLAGLQPSAVGVELSLDEADIYGKRGEVDRALERLSIAMQAVTQLAGTPLSTGNQVPDNASGRLTPISRGRGAPTPAGQLIGGTLGGGLSRPGGTMPAAPPGVRAQLMVRGAEMALAWGRGDVARETLEEALELVEPKEGSSDDEGALRIGEVLTLVAARTGDLNLSDQIGRRSVERARRLGDTTGLVRILSYLGPVWLAVAPPPDARALLETALADAEMLACIDEARALRATLERLGRRTPPSVTPIA